jgi:uncharacterized membrane protein
MQLNAIKLANAAAVTTFILFIVCTVFVAMAPEFSMAMFAGATHLPNLAGMLGAFEITLNGFLLGLVTFVISSYISAYIFASIYNRFIR